jgi:hypothetical protein
LDVANALVFLGSVVVVGAGLYFAIRTGLLGEFWEALQQSGAAAAARNAERRADRRREREVGIEVAPPPETLLNYVVEDMTRRGYALQYRTQETVSFSRDRGANSCLGCLLLLLFILPGILYLLLYNTTKRVSVTAYPLETGGSRLIIGGDDRDTVAELTRWARRMRG